MALKKEVSLYAGYKMFRNSPLETIYLKLTEYDDFNAGLCAQASSHITLDGIIENFALTAQALYYAFYTIDQRWIPADAILAKD